MIKAKHARVISRVGDVRIISGMRAIKFGVIHCTAGPRGQAIQEILDYWEHNNGWKNPGYHFIISEDGTIYELLPIDKISNGVAGHNSHSINICCVGGVDAQGRPIDNRTEAQILSLLVLISCLKGLFPNIVFLGHRDFSTDRNGNGILEAWEWIKSCPGYDFRGWLKERDFDRPLIPSKIIYKLNSPLIKNTVVGDIQIALRNYGFYRAKLDDIFGEETQKAVLWFQKSKSLRVTGVVDATTAKLLGVTI